MWGDNINRIPYLKTTCLTDVESIRVTHSTSDWYYLGCKTLASEPWHSLYVLRKKNEDNKNGLTVNYYAEYIL